MSQESFPRLLGDVGGTNARFALQHSANAEISDIRTLPTRDHATLEAAARHYLHQAGEVRPAQMAIGIANPVVGDWVQMTNHHWAFSIEAMRQSLGLQRFVVINDFTALALSLPALQPHELRQIGGGQAVARAPIGLVGAGTGLGVSGLLPVGEHSWAALAGEGGHVTLSPATPREWAVSAWLHERFGHASAERAVSGQGLENLYQALCAIDAVADAPVLNAAEVSQRGLSGQDTRCTEALELFCAFLGSVAGNLALTLGAVGGVYIGGGIAPRLGGFLDASALRTRFEAKGRFQPLLAGIPIFLIDAATSPALLGAARALD